MYGTLKPCKSAEMNLKKCFAVFYYWVPCNWHKSILKRIFPFKKRMLLNRLLKELTVFWPSLSMFTSSMLSALFITETSCWYLLDLLAHLEDPSNLKWSRYLWGYLEKIVVRKCYSMELADFLLIFHLLIWYSEGEQMFLM